MCVCVSMAGRVSILRFILTRVDLFVCMFVCVCVCGRRSEVDLEMPSVPSDPIDFWTLCTYLCCFLLHLYTHKCHVVFF